MNKILLSSNILWTITQFRLGLIKALVKAGYEVICVADTDDFSALSEQKIIDAGARFVRLKVNRKGINPFQDIKYAVGFYRILKREKPSVAINFTIKPIIYGSLAAAALKIPSLGVTTGLGFVFNKDTLLTRIVRKMYRFSLRFPFKALFLNPDDMSLFLSHNIINQEKAFWLQGEGIDTGYYRANESQMIDNKKDVITFILVARLLWEKGVGLYVDAARKMRSKYDDRASFHLLGYIDEDNPGGIKKKILDEWIKEGVPRTLMEAAAMSKPLIASDIPGCREVVLNEKNGFLCRPNDSDDLFVQMEKMMLMDAEERKKMGEAGRMLMLEKFDERIILDHYFRLLDEIQAAKKTLSSNNFKSAS